MRRAPDGELGLSYLGYILAGIRNKRGRNLAAAFCFALIAANLFSGQYITAGEVGSVDQGVHRMGADLLVVPPEYTQLLSGSVADDTMAIVAVLPSTYRFGHDMTASIGSVEGVAGASAQLYIASVPIPDLSPSPVHVYGIEPETDFTIQPWLRDPLDGPLGAGHVVVGHEVGGGVGQTITIAGRPYTVGGVLDPTQSGIDRSVFVPMDEAYALATATGTDGIAPGAANSVLVRVAPGADPAQVAARLGRQDMDAAVAVIERHFSLDPISQDLQSLPGVLNAIAAIVLIAAFPLVALIAAMVANERRREIGLLRSMGAGRATIVVLVMAESLVLAALGAVVGIAASWAALSALDANGLLNSALQVSFRIPGTAEVGVYAAVTLLLVIAMAALSSLYPAYRSSTMNAFDAIRGSSG